MLTCRRRNGVLTVSVNGYGKRTSSTNTARRGAAQGIVAMSVNHRNGSWWPRSRSRTADQIMLDDQGQ